MKRSRNLAKDHKVVNGVLKHKPGLYDFKVHVLSTLQQFYSSQRACPCILQTLLFYSPNNYWELAIGSTLKKKGSSGAKHFSKKTFEAVNTLPTTSAGFCGKIVQSKKVKRDSPQDMRSRLVLWDNCTSRMTQVPRTQRRCLGSTLNNNIPIRTH